MPELTDDKQQGAGDDAAAKAAAAANDAGNGAGDGEEMITVKKSEFEKIKSDRDNYRQATIDKKAKERQIDNLPAGNGNEGGAANQIDENKIKEIARAEATGTFKQIYDANESRAKRQFFKDNPEYLDDANWQRLIGNASFRRGKATVEDIMEDLGDAVLLDKKNTGKLDEYLKQQTERARQQGMMEGMMNIGHNAGGAGDRNQGNPGTGLTPKGEEMARRMHIDPAKVAKVDLSNDREIANP